ncbi:MAG: hypothetical protein ABSG55_06520 [Dehalococcoidia bacterium]
MSAPESIKVLFVAGFGPIVRARLLSPEGLLVGVTYTPWMRG